jgi:hypothetical protein
MKRTQQIAFEMFKQKDIKEFGGSLLKGNPKCKRVISVKKSMHLVMRSEMAHGKHSLWRFERRITEIISAQAKKAGVKVYRQANGGNHLHLTVLPRSRSAFNRFIRATSGLIARTVLGAERGNAKSIQFWDKRPYTKIIEWGREFKAVSNYLLQNTLEALGFIPYQPRKTRYSAKDSTA